MWAYSNQDVEVEFEGKTYSLLTKDEKYESEEARKWCLKYWNWHRKSFGTETTEQQVRDKFRFRCFQCQQPVSTVIIPKSDLDDNGKPVVFKRTPHFKCSVNNCYGGGKVVPVTDEFNVITDKSVLPVTELRYPPEEDTVKPQTPPKLKPTRDSGPQKKSRQEKKTSTSIAPLCEQFYSYLSRNELTKKFISIPFISKEAELSYNYLFVDMNAPEKSVGQKMGIYYGSPRFWAVCADAYLIVLHSSVNRLPLFIKLKKCESSLHAIEGASNGKLLFVLGDISVHEEYSLISSNSSFWSHALKLPVTDNYFKINNLVDKSDVIKSEDIDANHIIRRIISMFELTKESVKEKSLQTISEPAEDNIENDDNLGAGIVAHDTERNVSTNQVTKKISSKPKWKNAFEKLKYFFGF